MAGRTRTTKKLAQRIDRNYFKRVFPIPYWRRVLSVVLTAIGLLWVGWSLLSGKQAFNAGPLAHAHKIVGNDCQSCHKEEAIWGTKVSETACVTCHDGPVHQAKQTYKPECASCHVEHQNTFKLAATTSASCTQCHSDLKVTSGKPEFALNIKSLSDGHPEFAAVRPGHPPDPGTIKLNHFVHLKKDLKGPKGPVQMVCSDCHQELLPEPRVQTADLQTAAPQAATSQTLTPQMAAMIAPPVPMTSSFKSLSPQMAPVNFEKHCMSCHPLEFDRRFKDPAPHKEAKVVQAYLIDQYTNYIALHPDEVHERVQLNPALPPDSLNRVAPPAPANAAQWVAQRVEEAERLLFQKDCKECHDLTYPAPASPPDVQKANQTIKWMKNAWFDHKAHLLVDCTECHTDAPKSKLTADVLLPKIATCEKCHHEGPNAAVSQCYECHVYHDWSKAKPIKSTRTISEVLR
jgi:hypothetical protein